MELTIDQALQKGVEVHKAGQVQETDRLYTAILKAQPKHPDANHNMGVLAVGVDKIQEALPFFKTALETNPNSAQFWLSYVDALVKLDRLTDAKAVLDQAKDSGAKGEAFRRIEQKLKNITRQRTNQDIPEELLHHLKDFLGKMEFQDVLSESTKILSRFPNSASLYNIMGIAFRGLNQVEKAEKCYRRSIDLNPEFFKPCNNLGTTLQDQGKLEEAIEVYNKALSINPDCAEAAWNLSGTAKNISEAKSWIEYCLKADQSHLKAKLTFSAL